MSSIRSVLFTFVPCTSRVHPVTSCLRSAVCVPPASRPRPDVSFSLSSTCHIQVVYVQSSCLLTSLLRLKYIPCRSRLRSVYVLPITPTPCLPCRLFISSRHIFYVLPTYQLRLVHVPPIVLVNIPSVTSLRRPLFLLCTSRQNTVYASLLGPIFVRSFRLLTSFPRPAYIPCTSRLPSICPATFRLYVPSTRRPGLANSPIIDVPLMSRPRAVHESSTYTVHVPSTFHTRLVSILRPRAAAPPKK